MDWEKFFQVPTGLTLWQILDSQFLTTVLAAAFGLLLLRYESRLRDAQAEAQAADEALRARNEVERKEEEREVATPVGAGNRREEARALIEGAKDFLNKRAQEDPDGRHLRTYNKISGHHLADLALALRDRGQISDDQFDSAFALFSMWKMYARGKAANNNVSNQAYEEMKKLHEKLLG